VVGNLPEATTQSIDWSCGWGTPSGSSHSHARPSCVVSPGSEIGSDDCTDDGGSADDEVEGGSDKDNSPTAADDLVQKMVVASHENAGT